MELSNQEYAYLLKWIKNNITPTDEFSYKYGTSTLVKNAFEFSETGFYANEDCINKAMLECRFRVKNPKDLTWILNISKNSPAFSEPSVRKHVYIP